MKKGDIVSAVDVEMHIMDKKSIIIPQAVNLQVGVNPHFVSLYIREDVNTRIVAFTFEDWQKLHTRLYTRVPANMLIRKGGGRHD